MEDKTVRIATEKLSVADPSRTYEEHERYVRLVLQAVEERLVLRCLYDGVVAQLRPAKAAA